MKPLVRRLNTELYSHSPWSFDLTNRFFYFSPVFFYTQKNHGTGGCLTRPESDFVHVFLMKSTDKLTQFRNTWTWTNYFILYTFMCNFIFCFILFLFIKTSDIVQFLPFSPDLSVYFYWTSFGQCCFYVHNHDISSILFLPIFHVYFSHKKRPPAQPMILIIF